MVDIDDQLSVEINRGFVGVTVYGAAIIEAFLNAFFGYLPWDVYYRPDFFDEMLLSPDKKPRNLTYKA